MPNDKNGIANEVQWSSNQRSSWEEVVSNIARINEILPDAVVVGGTASAIYAEHRTSNDTDFVVNCLTT
jgi:hypothetical protein